MSNGEQNISETDTGSSGYWRLTKEKEGKMETA
jgi:hypothetical protein